MERKTRKDKIRNEAYRNNSNMKSVGTMAQEGSVRRWLRAIDRMSLKRVTKKVFESRIQGKNRRSTPRRN